jgi:hypothetical protein
MHSQGLDAGLVLDNLTTRIRELEGTVQTISTQSEEKKQQQHNQQNSQQQYSQQQYENN